MNRNNWHAFRITALLCSLTVPVAVGEAEWAATGLLLAALALCIAVSLVPTALTSAGDGNEDQGSVGALAEIAVSWLIVTATVTVLTWLLDRILDAPAPLTDPVNAVFEATSGVTTTGMTMVSRPDRIGPVLQWWRSMSQWLGGVGVVVFALLVAEPSGDRDAQLEADWSGAPAADRPAAAARRIAGIYVGLTAVVVVGLWLASGSLWTSLNHGATAIATGGFTVTANSAEALAGDTQIVLMAGCFIAAISFGTLWGVAHRTGPPLWKRTQVRWGLAILGLGATASMGAAADAGAALGPTLFNAVSASTTAGFAAETDHRFVPAITAIAIAGMAIGGAAGSTAGGLKVARVAWLAKAARRWLPQGGDPFDAPFRWDGEEVDGDEAAERVTGAAALAVVWLLAVVAGTYAVAFSTGADLGDSLFDAVSALSGVGLSSGTVDASSGAAPKLVLSGLMLIGRVEVTAFIALTYRAVVRANPRT